MYRPWVFVDELLSARPFPQLAWSVRGRSVVVHWKETFGPAQEFEITFDNALAGLVALDESTYASTDGYGIPGPDQFDSSGFTQLPWPAWRDEKSTRAAVYGDLGRHQ